MTSIQFVWLIITYTILFKRIVHIISPVLKNIDIFFYLVLVLLLLETDTGVLGEDFVIIVAVLLFNLVVFSTLCCWLCCFCCCLHFALLFLNQTWNIKKNTKHFKPNEMSHFSEAIKVFILFTYWHSIFLSEIVTVGR